MVPQPNGPSRKLGGILVETASNPATTTQPATLRYAIIGIGINLNQHTFPARARIDRDLHRARDRRTPHPANR
jgi:biotin-(acetyl-CoA carboxylase) ligase